MVMWHLTLLNDAKDQNILVVQSDVNILDSMHI